MINWLGHGGRPWDPAVWHELWGHQAQVHAEEEGGIENQVQSCTLYCTAHPEEGGGIEHQIQNCTLLYSTHIKKKKVEKQRRSSLKSSLVQFSAFRWKRESITLYSIVQCST